MKLELQMFDYEKDKGGERYVVILPLEEDEVYIKGIDYTYLSEAIKEELEEAIDALQEVLTIAIEDEHAFRVFKKANILGEVEVEKF